VYFVFFISKSSSFITSFPNYDWFSFRGSGHLLPHYIREGKSYLTIGFGCTGGHHRSVMIADEIGRRLKRAGYQAKTSHRDMIKPV